MTQDPRAEQSRPEADGRPEADQGPPVGERPEQHGPEMDDTQVEATGELRDRLDP